MKKNRRKRGEKKGTFFFSHTFSPTPRVWFGLGQSQTLPHNTPTNTSTLMANPETTREKRKERKRKEREERRNVSGKTRSSTFIDLFFFVFLSLSSSLKFTMRNSERKRKKERKKKKKTFTSFFSGLRERRSFSGMLLMTSRLLGMMKVTEKMAFRSGSSQHGKLRRASMGS